MGLVVIAVLLLLITAIIVYVLRMLFKFWQWNRAQRIAGVSVICPNCHRRIRLETFLCSNYKCRRPNKLVPTESNIWFNRCECGAKLPNTNVNGRNRLDAICPKCNYIIGKNAGFHYELVFPIVGGPSSGKSAFLNAWIVTMIQDLSLEYNFNVSFPFSRDSQYANNCIAQWKRGIKPDKTSIVVPSGFIMDMVKKGKDKGLRVCCYDPAGEFFDQEKKLKEFTYYDFMDGVIFLVDPFSMLPVREKYAKEIWSSTQHGFQISDRDINDYCDRFLNSLQRYHNLRYDQYHYANCAVVITKSDMFKLDSMIGERAVQRYMRKNQKITYSRAMDRICSRFLRESGMGDVLKKLKENFNEVRCFSISSFGHLPDEGGRYFPQRVHLPVRWLIEMAMQNVKGAETRLFRK